MHILRVAGVDYGNSVTVNGVGIIPFVGVGHIVASPSADSWLSARQGSLYGIDVEDGVADITLHVFKRIGVAILQGYVPIEKPNVPDCLLGIAILIWHPSGRKRT